MRAKAATLCIGLFLAAAASLAQNAPQAQEAQAPVAGPAGVPDYSSVYCSGFITSDRPNGDFRLISGEQSSIKIYFTRGDLVFLNRGGSQGIKVGDRFEIVRPASDGVKIKWFQWQPKLLKAMGQQYLDLGQVKVIHVDPNVATAEVIFSCDGMQRGDIVLPFSERPAPPYRSNGITDKFAPPSGKSVGMVVTGHDFTQEYGRGSIVYVNLGTNQGVHVGDYLRIFRYQGSQAETVPNTNNYQYQLYGFGSTPQRYKWNDLPRELLGEGVVLNVGPNSSTVMVTTSERDIWAGDYIEGE